MVPKRSLTNFGSTAGETSSVDSRNTPLQENLSVKVFLESCNPYQTFCRPKLVWSIGTECFVCHKYQDIALCVDVKEKKFVQTSPDLAHLEIYGWSSYCFTKTLQDFQMWKCRI